MTLRKLVWNTWKHYRKANVLLALGITLSTAIITGALIVGDSVAYSLEKNVDLRLGKITHVLSSGDRFFPYGNEGLNKELRQEGSHIAPLLKTNGMASGIGGELTIPKIEIWGADCSFSYFASPQFDSLEDGEVLLSENLAIQLQAKAGDEIRLKIRKLSAIPLNAPFVSDEDQLLSKRVYVKGIVAKEDLGRLSFENSQTAPLNAFVSLDWLNKSLEMNGKANLLVADHALQTTAVQQAFSFEDAGLTILEEDSFNYLVSERVFMRDSLAYSYLQHSPDVEGIVSYFVNALSSGGNSCPYSFVSSQEGLTGNEIHINSWLAADLGAGVGDTLRLDYFTVGPLRSLDSAQQFFVVSKVFDIDAHPEYRALMPPLPGLSDAGNCKNWETGVPIDLDRIRDKDEAYWDRYKGTPKAFISLAKAKDLWANRFGQYTALKVPADKWPDIQKEVRVDPFSMGYAIHAVAEEGREAAHKGQDFTSLFIGLSFFIILAGLILSALLFLLNLDQRNRQLATLRSMGFSIQQINKILLSEGLLVAFMGTLIGLLLAILYNKGVFMALNGVWQDIVRTEVLEVHIRMGSLLSGAAISLLLAFGTLWYSLRKRNKQNLRQWQSGVVKSKLSARAKAGVSISLLLVAMGLMLSQFLITTSYNTAAFFGAGGALLLAGILGLDARMSSFAKSGMGFDISVLSLRNLAYMRKRNVMVLAMLSLGAFIVISTGANRKDLFSSANDPKSGTGGYAFFAQSTLPILHDLNNEAVRSELALDQKVEFVQMRAKQGDEASCINLNRISRPRLLGVPSEALKGHFSLEVGSEDVEDTDFWSSLQQDGDFIPAIADQTVIKWSLGKEVGDTLIYRNETGEEMILKLVAGLKASVFQGHVMINEQLFIKHYPSLSGSSVFLIGGDTLHVREDLELAFKDQGWMLSGSAERLAMFKTVENTYLSIFLVLGMLGLLIGSIGLIVVLARSILQRRKELALMYASGFSISQLSHMLFREYSILLLLGIGSGTLSALVAVLPSLLQSGQVSIVFIVSMLAIILLQAFLWIYLISRSQIKRLSLKTALNEE